MTDAGLDRRTLLGTAFGVGVGLWIPSATATASESATRKVALTFDDGPNHLYTRQVVQLLDRRGVPGTFFVVGRGVSRNRDVLKYAVRHGHCVQVHSWDHARLDELSTPAIQASLTRTARAIKSATGVTPTRFRPPYGCTNDRVRAAGRAVGLTQTMWNAPASLKPPSVSAGVHEVMDYVEVARRNHQRSTILFHDGSGNQPMMLRVVSAVISRLRADGWVFVRLG